MAQNITRTTSQKLALFKRYFTGLPHAYGTYDPKTGQSKQIKQPVTDNVLLAHLRGHQPYGVYLLMGDKVRASAADFDNGDGYPPLQFLKRAEHHGLTAYLERSKSKGYHAWLFYPEEGVPACKARIVTRFLLDEIEAPGIEVFPKQYRLEPGKVYGNFINAPLFGKLVTEGRTMFVDPNNELKPFSNQWDVLEGIQIITEEQLNTVIEFNDLKPITAPPVNEGSPKIVSKTFGLTPCAARMLNDGVTEYQRVSCYRLAVQLRKTGLPIQYTTAILNDWRLKNRPREGKQTITEREIADQIKWAYRSNNRSCGCNDPAVLPYCAPERCPVNLYNQSMPNNPDQTRSQDHEYPDNQNNPNR